MLILFSIILGKVNFWDNNQQILIPSLTYGFIIGGILILTSLLQIKKVSSDCFTSVWGFAAGLILVFISDWLVRGYNLFQGPSARGELILVSILAAFTLRKKGTQLVSAFFVIGLFIIIFSFLSESKGQLLFSDDHASFIYRLQLLKSNFPNIPFYNPDWNAGFDSRDFFATGALSIYLLFLPIIYLFPIEEIYNLIVVSILFILLPASVFLASKQYKVSALASITASLLSLGVSLIWYRWALKYGTLGFILSTSLMPLVIAFSARFCDSKDPLKFKEYFIFFAALSICFMWPGSVFSLAPVALFILYSLPQISKNKIKIVFLTLFILVHVTWLGPFISVTKIGKFVTSESSSQQKKVSSTSALSNDRSHEDLKLFKMKPQALSIPSLLTHLREQVITVNPLIIFLAIPGIALLTRGIQKRVLQIQCLWLFLCGAILYPLKPQLELDRLLTVLVIILCVPTGIAFAALLKNLREEISESKIKSIVTYLAAGFLLSTPLATANIINNRSPEQYFFATSFLKDLSTAINIHAGDGRVLFSGFILQDISGGHVAPLPYFSNKQLITSAYYHTQWWYTDVIPESFRKEGLAGVQKFQDFYNVSAVIAHEPTWKKFFRSHPDQFQLVWQSGKFELFKRLGYLSNYFLEGSGEISKITNHNISLRLNSDSAVIKFTYFPFLTATDCELSFFEAFSGNKFIKLSNCPIGKEIKIESLSPWQRTIKGL
ncbi:MAG: hypothetical protein SGJ02_04505 [bacterium]|nr:hypothetical protein [bacterium]